VKVLVTGASGFIGGHVVRALQQCSDCEVVATGRDEARLAQLGVPFVAMALSEFGPGSYDSFGRPDALIHLAWPDLSSYRDPVHIERHLPESYRFIMGMAEAGVGMLSCVGTCYEYGLQEGCLPEDRATVPVLAYGVAKDSLRRLLECQLDPDATQFRWLRPFYTYGEGQQSRALLPQLDLAIDRCAETFDMSGGEQLRDYLEVSELAQAIVKSSLQNEIAGIINICSGKPVTVRALVEKRIAERGSSIRLRLGAYPYPDHEPMSFWGDTSRLDQAIAAYDAAHAGAPVGAGDRPE